VEVRAGAPAGAARGADALPGRDLFSRPHAPAGEVAVERAVPAAELDEHDVAIALVAARCPDRDDAPGLRGADDERAQDPDVEAGVPAAAVVAER